MSTVITIYTDGACSGNPGPSGLGVVYCEAGHCRELSEYLGEGTNNIAELTAILRGLEAVRDKHAQVRVFSDSQYAIGVLTKNWKAKANQQLIHKIKERLAQMPNVKLAYVRGHNGDPLNERADALAVDAVRNARSTGWQDAS